MHLPKLLDFELLTSRSYLAIDQLAGRRDGMKYDSRCPRHAQFIIFLEVHYHNSIVHGIGGRRVVVSPMTRHVPNSREDRCDQRRIRRRFASRRHPGSKLISKHLYLTFMMRAL